MHNEQEGYNQMFGGLQPGHFIYLLTLGSIGALLAYSLDLAVFEINSRNSPYFKTRSDKIAWAHDESYNWYLRYACWIGFHYFCMIICACIG